MDGEQWAALVRRLEPQARSDPQSYARNVALIPANRWRQLCKEMGLKTLSVVYQLLADKRLTGRKVRRGNTVRWDIDPESVAAEKERREQRAEPPSVYRPVHFVLPDTHEAMRMGDMKSLAPEDVADWVRRHRAAAFAAQDG